MYPATMDSLSLKIHSFLRSAGYELDSKTDSATQLVAYFESEYGLKMMGFFESEWVSEQIERDLTSEDALEMRENVSPERRHAFDRDVAAIWD